VGYTAGDLEDFLGEPGTSTWSSLHGNVAATTEHPRTGSHGLREIGGSTYPQVFGALDGTGVCVNVWYHEAMNTTTDFMALLRLWDTDTSVFTHHAIGTGVWTGASTTHYSHHTEGWVYTPSALPRVPGWRHLSIAMADATAELRVDGIPLATLDVLDPALVDRFSVEGYRGGTGWFDDAYVRRYTEPEPTVAVGPAAVAGVDLPAATPSIHLEQNVPNPLNPATVIAFTVPRDGAVRLQVFDLKGRVVRTLVDGLRTAGRHEVRWDGLDQGGSAAASGTYLYRLTTAEGTVARKLALVR
ncbi:MAG: FlgD immunoglobulin-like domain containing protein, partial [Candidatus Krumholzibacteriia bacterium]